MKLTTKRFNLIPFVIFSAILFAGAPAFPSTDFYSKIGLNYNTLSESLNNEDINLDMLTFSLAGGIEVSPYIAFEGRVGFGLNDASDEVPSKDPHGRNAIDSVDVKYKNSFGVYFKPQLPVNDIFLLYGLVGYTVTSIDIEISRSNRYGSAEYSDSEDGSDLGFGFGMEFSFNNNVGIAAEFARLTGEVNTLGVVAKIMF